MAFWKPGSTLPSLIDRDLENEINIINYNSNLNLTLTQQVYKNITQI